jgi:hypothetical protein
LNQTGFNYLEFDEQIIVNPVGKMRINIKEPKTIPKVMELKRLKKYSKQHIKIESSLKSKTVTVI